MTGESALGFAASLEAVSSGMPAHRSAPSLWLRMTECVRALLGNLSNTDYNCPQEQFPWFQATQFAFSVLRTTRFFAKDFARSSSRSKICFWLRGRERRRGSSAVSQASAGHYAPGSPPSRSRRHRRSDHNSRRVPTGSHRHADDLRHRRRDPASNAGWRLRLHPQKYAENELLGVIGSPRETGQLG